MSGFFDKLGESVREASKGVVRKSEMRLRVERLKMDIRDLREQKDQKMRDLAHKVYERYVQGTLQDPEFLAACQDIKSLQWQIDERWTEVNHLNVD